MAEAVPNGSAVFIGPDGRVVARQQAGKARVSASTIKLPLVLEVLRQESLGALDLSEQYTVRAADVVGGTGILQQQVGRTLPLRELARLAIVYSDNVAANVLLDRLGMERLNASLRAAGFAGTRFERRFLDTAAQARGLENWTTADDLAQMLRGVWARTLFGPAVSERMLELLKERGGRDPDWLGLGLPPDARLFHLNGTLAGVRNDAGIVSFGRGQAYVLVVCQDQLPDEARGERAIAALARRVHPLVAAAKNGLP